MKHLTIFYIILSIFFIGCSEELIDTEIKGKIEGIVKKAGTDEPLSNVKINTNPTTSEVYTDDLGSFVINDVPVGDYSLKAELEGYLLSYKSINIVNREQVVNTIIELNDDESLNSPPSTPQPISPEDYSMEQPIRLQFNWSSTDADDDTLTYKLILRNSVTNQETIYDNLSENSFEVDNLLYGNTYYWQVIVNDGTNDDVLSEVFQFTTTDLPQNRFMFVRELDGNLVIYSTNEQNQHFQLTTSNYSSWRPRANLTTGKIAFLRTDTGNTHLYTMDKDGSNKQRVTTTPIASNRILETQFSWNLSGSQLIFPSLDKLYRINADGSGLEQIYQTPNGKIITECDWSTNGNKIALKTNNLEGYEVEIYTIDLLGNVLNHILQNVAGAASGISFDIQGEKVLYSYDVSGYENPQHRQLDTRIFLYDINNNTARDISQASGKTSGTLDLEPRFSPNNGEIIFTNTSNDMVSERKVFTMNTQGQTIPQYNRQVFLDNARMPDWE